VTGWSCGLALLGSRAVDVTETFRVQLVLFGMQNRTFGPCLATIHRILISVGQALGVAVDLGPAGVRRCIEAAGVGFMFAPRYHPAMKVVSPVRRALKVRV
jgi:Glycosyl transferase family, a/b domain